MTPIDEYFLAFIGSMIALYCIIKGYELLFPDKPTPTENDIYNLDSMD